MTLYVGRDKFSRSYSKTIETATQRSQNPQTFAPLFIPNEPPWLQENSLTMLSKELVSDLLSETVQAHNSFIYKALQAIVERNLCKSPVALVRLATRL